METKLYKRAVNGEPLVWWIRCAASGGEFLGVGHGKVNGIIYTDCVRVTMTDAIKEYTSRVNAKRKEGYISLEEVHDNAPKNLTDDLLYDYLNKYLPKYNTSSNGNILPMLAKTLEDNRIFTKFGAFRGQWKINGLRCIVRAFKSNDLFRPFNLKFQSREGTDWNLPYLEEKLLNYINGEILELMLDTGASLDGEVYLPGYSVNDINHFVKNPNCKEHKLLQYWMYDIAVENMFYRERRMILKENFEIKDFKSKEDHLANTESLILLPEIDVHDFNSAIAVRDNFIDLGFEGLILRNPNSEYGFNKRSVGLMHKFKKIEDGYFTIVDVVPEGKKRSDFGKLVLRNDINDNLFECTLNASHGELRELLCRRDEFIGKEAFVQYRERSGVDNVPFHAKAIYIK